MSLRYRKNSNKKSKRLFGGAVQQTVKPASTTWEQVLSKRFRRPVGEAGTQSQLLSMHHLGTNNNTSRPPPLPTTQVNTDAQLNLGPNQPNPSPRERGPLVQQRMADYLAAHEKAQGGVPTGRRFGGARKRRSQKRSTKRRPQRQKQRARRVTRRRQRRQSNKRQRQRK